MNKFEQKKCKAGLQRLEGKFKNLNAKVNQKMDDSPTDNIQSMAGTALQSG